MGLSWTFIFVARKTRKHFTWDKLGSFVKCPVNARIRTLDFHGRNLSRKDSIISFARCVGLHYFIWNYVGCSQFRSSRSEQGTGAGAPVFSLGWTHSERFPVCHAFWAWHIREQFEYTYRTKVVKEHPLCVCVCVCVYGNFWELFPEQNFKICDQALKHSRHLGSLRWRNINYLALQGTSSHFSPEKSKTLNRSPGRAKTVFGMFHLCLQIHQNNYFTAFEKGTMWFILELQWFRDKWDATPSHQPSKDQSQPPPTDAPPPMENATPNWHATPYVVRRWRQRSTLVFGAKSLVLFSRPTFF